MLIKNLKLRNIGPFKEAELNFAYEKDDANQPPVTIITGMNGTGKSIIIDAIRAALSGDKLERDIVADKDFDITVELNYHDQFQSLSTNGFDNLNNYCIKGISYDISTPLRFGYNEDRKVFPWILDYWTAGIPKDSFKIDNLNRIDHYALMKEVMTGKKSNVKLTNFLVNLDYMRGSEDEKERSTANVIFKATHDILNKCLDNGKFLHIRRKDLMPIFIQNGQEITLDKLSNGNIMLIEHLVMLLSKMYSLSVLLNLPAEDILKSPGLLLIDEIETHLHPRWQKSILPIIRNTFPNIQIILTTHSPFVLSSLPGARIYTCKSEPGKSIVEDETDMYSSMPVDEILISDAFNVAPFNNYITELLKSRKTAIENRDKVKSSEIERELYNINPEYFSYLNSNGIKDLIQQLDDFGKKEEVEL